MKSKNNQNEKSLIELKGDLLKKEYEYKEVMAIIKSDKTKRKENNKKSLKSMFYILAGFFFAVFSFYGSIFINVAIGNSIWIGMTYGVFIACVTYSLIIQTLNKEE